MHRFDSPCGLTSKCTMKFSRCTRRLYYEDFHLCQAETRVVQVGPDYVELEATVAYPEGGGQEPDHGTLTFENGVQVPFLDVQRMYGHACGFPDFPQVQVGGVIWHRVPPEMQSALASLKPGMPVCVEIDTTRRARLSLSHTASHLLYLAIGLHRPDAPERTIGCHIREDAARFDFAVEERFTPEQIESIAQVANALVARDAPITFSAHPDEPDARRWHCDGHVIACGGTHLDRTGAIGPLEIRRKRLGTGKERLGCTFSQARLDLARYHPRP